MNISEQAQKLLDQLSVEEKAELCVGGSFWQSPGNERLGLKQHIMTDGPHGLRKQEKGADHLGINQSLPAVCFPTACATACSFDRELLEEMGSALGDKCNRENVAVLLGPGVNIKRSPLCGRNFEYFSEDPCLAGELGAAFTRGVQSKNVGVSVKHFAANSQETNRMTVDSVIDQRALYEIYLEAFRRVTEAKPWTVMCSYNRINGEYANTNYWLLSKVLRDEWKFDGLVMSDWGAVSDRVEGIKAGMDLEMPGVGPDSAEQIVQAVKEGSLAEEQLDRCTKRMLELILKMQQDKPPVSGNDDNDHELAGKIAAQSAVLLKNEDNILPLKKDCKIAFIGEMAKKPRYQGAGSSKINAYRVDNAYDQALKAGLQVSYTKEYSEAARVAEEADVAVVFAGLPDAYESEGFDRENMEMPVSHVQLIEAVAAVNPCTVVVLQCGSPVELDWRKKVKGILLMYLGGEAGAAATIDLLTGRENPCGKLAETWPEKFADTPCADCYPGKGRAVWHRESIFVGYRYYDAAGVQPAFPFGYGLSYTQFQYDDLQITRTEEQKKNHEYIVSAVIKNTGTVAGKEIVQLYLSKKGNSTLFRAPSELKNFTKIMLAPGEEKRINMLLKDNDAAYYNTVCKKWCIEGGEYEVRLGASSRDFRLVGEIILEGDGKETLLQGQKDRLSQYNKLQAPLAISDEQFLELLGNSPTPESTDPVLPYTINSTMGEIKNTWIGKKMMKKAAASTQALGKDPSMKRMMEAMFNSTPIRSFRMVGGMNWKQVHGIAELANGHWIKGFRLLIQKNK